MGQGRWKGLAPWDGDPNQLDALRGLGTPLDAEELATKLNAVARPYYTPEDVQTAGTIHVDVDDGDDDLYDGTSATVGAAGVGPFATIARALQRIGTANRKAVVIQLAVSATPYTLPFLLTEANYVTIKGGFGEVDPQPTVLDATVQSDGRVELTFSGTGAVTAPVPVEYLNTTPSTASARGWIYEAQSLASTTVASATRDYNTIWEPSASLNLRPLGVTIEIEPAPGTSGSAGNKAALIVSNSVQCNFQDVKIVTPDQVGVLYVLNSDKVEFNNCYVRANHIRAGRFGSVFLINTYVDSHGDSTFGVFSAVNKGDCQLGRGSVIDASNVTATTSALQKVRCASGAKVSFVGEQVLKGLSAEGIQVDGSEWAASGGIDNTDILRFVSCGAGLRINTTGEGIGGAYQLPNLHGSVGSTYWVTATAGANVHLAGDSSQSSRAVSADDGTSAVAQASDGTYIVGGSPSPDGFEVAGAGDAAVADHESAYDHANLPTSGQKDALGGTSGAPGTSNKFVTDSDDRLKTGSLAINATNESNANTTAQTPQSALSATASSLVPGKYLFCWHAEISPATNETGFVRARLAGATRGDHAHSVHSPSTFSGHFVLDQTTTSDVTAELEYWSLNGGMVDIDRRRLTLLRLS